MRYIDMTVWVVFSMRIDTLLDLYGHGFGTHRGGRAFSWAVEDVLDFRFGGGTAADCAKIVGSSPFDESERGPILREAAVTFAVSIFDLFSFGFPGALQLSILVYVLDRLGVVHVSTVASMPTALLVAGAVVGSYLLGRLCHPLGAPLERLVPRWRLSPDTARREFLARVPQAQDRSYVHADPALLLAAAETRDMDAAGDIVRMRAQSLMLRNTTVALALAVIIALVELAVGDHRLVAGGGAVLLLLAALGAMREGRNLWHVSRLKTLEICFWIPGIDQKIANEGLLARESE